MPSITVLVLLSLQIFMVLSILEGMEDPDTELPPTEETIEFRSLRRSSTSKIYEFWTYINKTNDLQKSKCVGTLFDDRWVLTSASCVTQPNTTTPYRGIECQFTHNYEKFNFPDEVILTIIHPGYNPTTLQDDIAILKLRQGVLARYANSSRVYLEGFTEGESGLFQLKNDPVDSWKLNERSLKLIQENECSLFEMGYSKSNKLCSTTKLRDGNQDFTLGGPLLTRNNDKFKVLGVNSVTTVVGSDTEIQLFTDVKNYELWISLRMLEN